MITDMYDFAFDKAEEARAWSSADGCEGGDFLDALAGALEMWHYSQGQDATALKLITMINEEIEGFKTDERIVRNYREITGQSQDNHVG